MKALQPTGRCKGSNTILVGSLSHRRRAWAGPAAACSATRCVLECGGLFEGCPPRSRPGRRRTPATPEAHTLAALSDYSLAKDRAKRLVASPPIASDNFRHRSRLDSFSHIGVANHTSVYAFVKASVRPFPRRPRSIPQGAADRQERPVPRPLRSSIMPARGVEDLSRSRGVGSSSGTGPGRERLPTANRGDYSKVGTHCQAGGARFSRAAEGPAAARRPCPVVTLSLG